MKRIERLEGPIGNVDAKLRFFANHLEVDPDRLLGLPVRQREWLARHISELGDIAEGKGGITWEGFCWAYNMLNNPQFDADSEQWWAAARRFMENENRQVSSTDPT
jgi:hypothetical protein